jgi:hypothetical protein
MSSMLIPTAPAAITRRTVSATASGVAPYACSISAVTGTDTARAIRATASIISRAGTTPPSGYPSAAATPALVVAIAGNPSAWKRRALTASTRLAERGWAVRGGDREGASLCRTSSLIAT